MTIPEDVWERAAEAAYLSNPIKPVPFSELDRESQIAWRRDLEAALPILRSAIRAELVREMIADLDAERITVTWPKGTRTEFPRSMIQCATMQNFIRTYLPESETTDDES